MTCTNADAGPCPACGELIDGHTAMQKGATPKPDDFSVCAYCGTVLIYAADLLMASGLRFRLATAEEVDEVLGGPYGDLVRHTIQIAPRIFPQRGRKGTA